MPELNITISKFGSDWLVECSQCGTVTQTGTLRYAKQEKWEHRRYDHPTADERAYDEVREAEYRMPGCYKCGHEDHKSNDCPFVTPDLLK